MNGNKLNKMNSALTDCYNGNRKTNLSSLPNPKRLARLLTKYDNCQIHCKIQWQIYFLDMKLKLAQYEIHASGNIEKNNIMNNEEYRRQ